ncbi:MAG TPA: hypothetical protein PLF88_02425 [Opitutaceae bacterium]|nr:hypothetical protein [Opitutaceae bacterium]HRJ46302.1 hypothetical protein [Opitutaceae bacterium]
MSNPNGLLTITAASPIPIVWQDCTGVEYRRPLAAPIIGVRISSLIDIPIIIPVIIPDLQER